MVAVITKFMGTRDKQQEAGTRGWGVGRRCSENVEWGVPLLFSSFLCFFVCFVF